MTNITFAVTSDAICFGPLVNILDASRRPIQPPPNPRPRLSGTVVIHELEYNVPAKNGTWNASSRSVVAAHETVEPLPELRKLLRVAGSPYEYEFGNRNNSDATRGEYVLLFNRYDWKAGMLDLKEIPEEEDEDDPIGSYNSIGLVDYVHAATQAQDWASQPCSNRDDSQHGIWMYIPEAEYMWVRLGFDDGYTHARSLLFFTQRTDFFETKFPDEAMPLRTYETSLQIFRRGLREGRDYSGVAMLRELHTLPAPEMQAPESPYMPAQPPPAASLLGPYPKNEHILSPQDIEALLKTLPSMTETLEQGLRRDGVHEKEIEARRRSMEPGVFAEPFKDEIYDLLNELVMSYLEHFVLPLSSHEKPSTLGPALFLNHAGEGHFDIYLFKQFSESQKVPFDVVAVTERIQEFLYRRARENTIKINRECITSLTNVVAYILSELLEYIDRFSFGRDKPEEREVGEKYLMVPCHVRSAVYYTSEMFEILQYSAVFWAGRS